MICHEILPGANLVETYLNLEELVCLSKITNTICYLKAPQEIKDIFDLSSFELVDKLPDAIPCDISDYVCVYDIDFKDLDGSEFISYRKNQSGKIFRLDRFQYQDLCVNFSKSNYYESKYFTNDRELYSAAKLASFNFGLSEEFITKWGFIKSLFKPMPLLCLKSSGLAELMAKEMIFPFAECYYICDDEVFEEFFIKHNLNAQNVKKYLLAYHPSFSEPDLDMLMLLIDKFTDI